MKNVLERFEKIVQLAYSTNKAIQAKGYDETSAVGYGPRFRKMLHKNGKRVHSMGIYDYYTKKYVFVKKNSGKTVRGLLTVQVDKI